MDYTLFTLCEYKFSLGVSIPKTESSCQKHDGFAEKYYAPIFWNGVSAKMNPHEFFLKCSFSGINPKIFASFWSPVNCSREN